MIDLIPSKVKFRELILNLKFESYDIIIPRVVYQEYINKSHKKKKILNKVINKFQLRICDIKNSFVEINKLPIDSGEADAFFQIKKMKNNPHYQHYDSYLFITNDKKAKRYFLKHGIIVKDLRDMLNQT